MILPASNFRAAIVHRVPVRLRSAIESFHYSIASANIGASPSVRFALVHRVTEDTINERGTCGKIEVTVRT